jgi:hypothetical protein
MMDTTTFNHHLCRLGDAAKPTAMRDNGTFILPFFRRTQNQFGRYQQDSHSRRGPRPLTPMSFQIMYCDALNIPPSPQGIPMGRMGRQKQPDKRVVSATITCQIHAINDNKTHDTRGLLVQSRIQSLPENDGMMLLSQA